MSKMSILNRNYSRKKKEKGNKYIEKSKGIFSALLTFNDFQSLIVLLGIRFSQCRFLKRYLIIDINRHYSV
jgi:hypothetical protein